MEYLLWFVIVPVATILVLAAIKYSESDND
jgi:hypothetical protein